MLKEKELQSCTSVAGNTSSLFLPGDSKLGVLFLWVGGGGKIPYINNLLKPLLPLLAICKTLFLIVVL